MCTQYGQIDAKTIPSIICILHMLKSLYKLLNISTYARTHTFKVVMEKCLNHNYKNVPRTISTNT